MRMPSIPAPCRPTPWLWRHARLAALAVAALPSSLALACGPYQVGVPEHGRAYYRDAQGQALGVDVDLIATLARRSGCQLLLRAESRARIWDQFAKGTLDMTTSVIPSPERSRFGEFWPYGHSRNLALLHKSLAERISTAEAFIADRSLHAVVVRGYQHGPQIDQWLAQLRAQGRVHEVGDFNAALRSFRARRVELMFSHPGGLKASKLPWLDEVSLQDWAPQDDVLVTLLVSTERIPAEDRQRLQQHFRAMRRDGTVDAILAKHLGEAFARQVRLPPDD